MGIPQVDEEHRHLFALVKGLSLETVQAAVEELLDYVVVHFSNEQALMEKSGYPAFEQHLKQHEDLAASVGDFLSSGGDWTEDRVQDLRRFLNKWLVGHIMTHDLRFGKWYVEKGALLMAQTQALKVHPAPARSGFFAGLFGRK